MSGTSLDGIDLAHIFFNHTSGNWSFDIAESATVAYPDAWLNRLRNAVSLSQTGLEDLNRDYTPYLGSVIFNFIDQNKIKDLNAVCSHGHTILHQPQNGFTLQIGNLPELAEITGQKVVCDFRVADVELGGQGAPLVPIGDKLLFRDFDYCLNLGGFSNVSFEENGTRLAFDISAVNTVLNNYANELGFDYDDKGEISRGGNLNEAVLTKLNSLEFYSTPFPKSLGFEYVKEVLLPLLDEFKIPPQDKLRTFTEHIAVQIALALPQKRGKMLVTGGGAYNDFLIERMKALLPEMTIEIPQKQILEYKEALIFGLLGVLRLRNEVNVLASVTGAKRDHSSGKIFKPYFKS
jgi:anhydro-N-acetylmuramic acid kinase